jgi:nucleotide-binding universal stress UspA family protein
MFVGDRDLDAYYDEEADRGLAPARAALDAAGVPYAMRREVGHVADTILRCARDWGADRILMGRKGRSDLADRVLGSIASDVSQRAEVPVTLVR